MKRACLLLTTAFLAAAPATAQPQVRVNLTRGLYDAPFTLVLSTDAPAAEIRYTTDGSVPHAGHGTRYTAPIRIEATTVLRAIALTSIGASAVETHTYLFPADALDQPTDIPDYPRRPYAVDQTTRRPLDYRMDPRITADPVLRAETLRGLRALPTLSLAMDPDDFWDVHDAEEAVERPVSVEVLYPDDPAAHEQVNAGLEGHSWNWMKRSFRLVFSRGYGPARWDTELLRRAPLGGATAARRIDRLVLRGGNNRSWARGWNPDRTTYTRDQWYRDTQIAVSGFGAHGAFVHLYVNGIYWGLYNPVERPDAGFASAYFGGSKDDWFTWAQRVRSGVPTRYDYLLETLAARDLRDPSAYAEIQDFLDLTAFIDYLILTWMTGMVDWPENNVWAAHRMSPPEPLLFFGWDAEWSWDTALGGSDGAWVHPQFRRSAAASTLDLARLWHALWRNPEFKLRFADRVYRHTHHDGALSDTRSRTRWAAVNDAIRSAVVAESARWGDATGTLYTRDTHWQPEVDRIDGLMNGNVARFLDALRAERYYPELDPPAVDPPGGAPGTLVRLTNPNDRGVIVYTLDGRDPRETGTSYAGPFRIDMPTVLRARVRDGETWSALAEIRFAAVDPRDGLVVNEVMYHAAGPDGDALDFLELLNHTEAELLLDGLRFVTGIRYAFPDGARLPPGGFVVLAEDAAAFAARYGFAPFGQYRGRLDNDGEPLALIDALGRVVDAVDYRPAASWPPAADGHGASLELRDPALDNTDPRHWRASPHLGGSPGAANGTRVSTRADHAPRSELRLAAPWPNPAAARIHTEVAVPFPGPMHLALYDLLGRRRALLHDGPLQAAPLRFALDVSALPAGVYVLRLEAGTEVRRRIVTVAR